MRVFLNAVAYAPYTPPMAGSGPSKEAVARFELARAVRNSSKPSSAASAMPSSASSAAGSAVYQIGRVGVGNPRAMHIGVNGVQQNGHAYPYATHMYP